MTSSAWGRPCGGSPGPAPWARSSVPAPPGLPAGCEAGAGRAASPGTVLAPDGLSTTVVVTQTGVKVVAPRDYYLDYLSDDPDFLYEERLLLSRFANADPTAATPEVALALDRLDV